MGRSRFYLTPFHYSPVVLVLLFFFHLDYIDCVNANVDTVEVLQKILRIGTIYAHQDNGVLVSILRNSQSVFLGQISSQY